MEATQNGMEENAIETRDLRVVYRRFLQPAVDALDGLTFSVGYGEVFGFLGPNGAGKSTTIKTLLGFVFAQQGEARILGKPAGSLEARKRIGYLPEVAVYYPYLKASEMLNMYGRIQGLSRDRLKREIPETLEKVGLSGKDDTLLKHFSKGMLQRVGLAQALLGDPDVYILDEPASGLDPIGRRDLRQVIMDLRDKGKTIFFSSHELSEVEMICHRIAILKDGQMILEGSLSEIVEPLKANNQNLEDFFVDIITKHDATGSAKPDAK